jgi:hypothetical protein
VTDAARQALQGQAAQTAFSIGVGVGVAVGSIAVETYLRYRVRLLDPVVDVVSARLSQRRSALIADRRARRQKEGNYVDHSWQNRNRKPAAQGPIVMLPAIRRRAT